MHGSVADEPIHERNLQVNEIELVVNILVLRIQLFEFERNDLKDQEVQENYSASLTAMCVILRKICGTLKKASYTQMQCMKPLQKLISYSRSIMIEMTEKKVSFTATICDQFYTIGHYFELIGIIYHNQELYDEAFHFINFTCELMEFYCQIGPEFTKRKVTFWNKFTVMLLCLRRVRKYQEALDLLDKCAKNHFEDANVCMLEWIKLKKDEVKNNIHKPMSRALKNIFIHSQFDVFKMLYSELMKSKSSSEKYFLAQVIETEAADDIQKAVAYIELGKFQHRLQNADNKPALEYVRNAVSLLEAELKHLKIKDDRTFVKLQLASALHWLYILEIAPKSFSKANDNDEEMEKAIRNEDLATPDAGDVVPFYCNNSIEVEQQRLHPLFKALNIWSELTNMESWTLLIDARIILAEIKTVAEIFHLAKQIPQEIQAWKLVRSLAVVLEEVMLVIQSSCKLATIYCQTNDLNLAEESMKLCMDAVQSLDCNNPDECGTLIEFKLMQSRLYLHLNQVQKGVRELNSIWNLEYLKKKRTMAADLMFVEMKLLACTYVERLSILKSEKLDDVKWFECDPLEHVEEAASCCCRLIKSITSKQSIEDCNDGIGYDAVACLFEVVIKLSELYIKIGAPREALCYLKQLLNWSCGVSSAIRMGEVLLALSKIDLLCNNENDCQVKLSGVAYILNYDTETKLDEKGDFVKMNELKLTNATIPPILLHPSSCNCCCCTNVSLYNLAVRFILLQSQLLLCRGETANASLLIDSILQKCNESDLTNSLHYKDVNCGRFLQKNFIWIEVLLQSSRIFYSEKKYMAAFNVAHLALTASEQLNHASRRNDVEAELVWQKCLCFVPILAKVHNMPAVQFICKKLMRQNFEIDELSALVNSITSLNLNGKPSEIYETSPQSQMPKSTGFSIETPCKQSAHSVAAKKTCRKTNTKPCRAPVKKISKRNMTNIPNVQEPDERSSSESMFDASQDLFMSPPNSRALRRNEKIKIPQYVVIDSTSDSDSDVFIVDEIVKCKILKPANTCKKTKKQKSTYSSDCHDDDPVSLHERNISMDSRLNKKHEVAVESKPSERLTRSRGRLLKSAKKSDLDSNNENLLCEVAESTRSAVSTVHKKRIVSSEVQNFNVQAKERVGTNDKLGKKLLHTFCSSISNDKLESIDENSIDTETIVSLLESAIDLIARHPPNPLYSNLCLMLLIFKGIWHCDAGFYLSESVFVTLRHQAILNLNMKVGKAKKIRFATDEKKDQFVKDSRDILKFLQPSTGNRLQVLQNRLKYIPAEWTICQIAVLPEVFQQHCTGTNHQLIIGRYQKGKDPVVVTSLIQNGGKDGARSLLTEFQAIMTESKESMKITERSTWWKIRKSLDSRLKMLIRDMEEVWLSCWKCLLLGDTKSGDRNKVLRSATEKVVEQFDIPSEIRILIQLILDSGKSLSEEQLLSASTYICDVYLKNKSALDLHCAFQKQIKIVGTTDDSRHPVILILNKDVECMPWESLPILKDQAVSRFPSLSLLHNFTMHHHRDSNSVFKSGANLDNTYYVLNPDNDLPNCEKRFLDWFERNNWQGIVGRNPKPEELISAIQDHHLFLYCGHGTGRKYLSGCRIQHLDCKAVTLLMGCSSGRLKLHGKQLDPEGVVLQYLLAGSPFILAALWDVTDKDIDRYLEYLIKNWSSNSDLAQLIPDARKACYLPFMVGSAPVIYGLPTMSAR